MDLFEDGINKHFSMLIKKYHPGRNHCPAQHTQFKSVIYEYNI